MTDYDSLLYRKNSECNPVRLCDINSCDADVTSFNELFYSLLTNYHMPIKLCFLLLNWVLHWESHGKEPTLINVKYDNDNRDVNKWSSEQQLKFIRTRSILSLFSTWIFTLIQLGFLLDDQTSLSSRPITWFTLEEEYATNKDQRHSSFWPFDWRSQKESKGESRNIHDSPSPTNELIQIEYRTEMERIAQHIWTKVMFCSLNFSIRFVY